MRSLKSLVISILFLTLVVSLFFIPEIVDAYKTYSNQSTVASSFSGLMDKASEESSAEIKEESDAIKYAEINSSDSPKSSLDKVLALVSSDYLSNPTGEPKASINLSTMDLGLKPIEGRGVTWQMITQESVKKTFRIAQAESANILKELSDDNVNSKNALVTFINALTWIQKGDKDMKPEKALNYIEELDFNVSENMFKEGVDRGIFLKWTKINLGELLSNSKAQRARTRMALPFNPRTTLASIEIRRPQRIDYRKYLSRGKNIPTRINISGFIMGSDTKTLELYRNATKVSRISISKKPDNEGKRLFRFAVNKGEGLYTIRAIDSFNYVHDTHYQFFPRAEIFPRQKNRIMLIPVALPQNKRKFSLSEVDGRVDGLFRVSLGTSYSDANSQFDTF